MSQEFAVLLPDQRNRFWVQIKNQFVRHFAPQTPLLLYSDSDTFIQNGQLRDLALTSIRTIIIAPVDSIDMGKQLSKPEYQSFTVISLRDMILDTDTVRNHVGADSEAYARHMSSVIAQRYSRHSLIVIGDADRVPIDFLRSLEAGVRSLESFFIRKQGNSYSYEQIAGILAPYSGDILVVSDQPLLLALLELYRSNEELSKIVLAEVGISRRTYARFEEQSQVIAVFEDAETMAGAAIDLIMTGGRSLSLVSVDNGKKKVPTVYVSPSVALPENYADLLKEWK